MKQITKRSEPSYFTEWKDDFRRLHGREPEYKDFHGTSEWEDLIYDLLEEQGYICCYCMKEINGWDSHIEHFVPRNIKNTYPHSVRAQNVELDYQNLFESCNGEENQWDHCGRLKDSDENPMLVSPLESGVEQRFKYDMLTGEIDASDPEDQEAMTTIRILGLNTYQLCRHRINAFNTADQEFRDGIPFDELIGMYSNRDDRGAFIPYCVAVTWVLEHFYHGLNPEDL